MKIEITGTTASVPGVTGGQARPLAAPWGRKAIPRLRLVWLRLNTFSENLRKPFASLSEVLFIFARALCGRAFLFKGHSCVRTYCHGLLYTLMRWPAISREIRHPPSSKMKMILPGIRGQPLPRACQSNCRNLALLLSRERSVSQSAGTPGISNNLPPMAKN